MSWAMQEPPAGAPLGNLFSTRPELFEKYKAFYGEIWNQDVVPGRVLELCRRRIAAIHGCLADVRLGSAEIHLKPEEAEALAKGDTSPFDSSERVALELAEKIPFNHHSVADDDVAAAREAFGASGAVTLLIALSFFDVTCRWQLALGAP